jgi:Uma2 family endonuclease
MVIAAAPETRIGMSMNEFIRAFAEDGPFELIDGKRVALMPNMFEHSLIVRFLLKLLFALEQSAGVLCFPEASFVVDYTPNWVRGSRVPDIAIYKAERIVAYKAEFPWTGKPIALVPDLCIEVVSPTDNFSEVELKAQRYLTDGVLLVWVVDLGSRCIYAYTAGSTLRTTLHEDDLLEGGGVVQGFSVRVGDVFSE